MRIRVKFYKGNQVAVEVIEIEKLSTKEIVKALKISPRQIISAVRS
jgi:hypothetical protein